MSGINITSVGAPLTLSDFHSVFTDDYEEFRGALDSIERQMEAAQNADWMAALTPANSPSQDGVGLFRLGMLAGQEWQVRNPVLATAHDQNEFPRHLSTYQEEVARQREIAVQLRRESLFSQVQPTGEPYWQNLYALAERILDQSINMLREEETALQQLQSAF